MTAGCRYAEQRKRIRSVMRCGEDSSDLVVSVTNVSENVGEDDFVARVDGKQRPRLSIERNV